MLVSWLSDAKDGGDMSLRNVGWLSADSTVLYPNSSLLNVSYSLAANHTVLVEAPNVLLSRSKNCSKPRVLWTGWWPTGVGNSIVTHLQLLCFTLGPCHNSDGGRLPTAKTRFELRSGHVGFLVDKVALRQVFYKYLGLHCQFLFHRLLC
jgi:hypothetical protein